MPETGGLFIIDGESAGSTPWEFDSLSEEGSNTVALAAAAKNNGDYGYKITFDGTSDYAYVFKTFVVTGCNWRNGVGHQLAALGDLYVVCKAVR